MSNVNKEEKSFQKTQQGSGSAENKGQSRQAQKTKTSISEEEKKNIADQTRLKRDDIRDLKEAGALSGRDDVSGGSGDGMTSTSTNEETNK